MEPLFTLYPLLGAAVLALPLWRMMARSALRRPACIFWTAALSLVLGPLLVWGGAFLWQLLLELKTVAPALILPLLISVPVAALFYAVLHRRSKMPPSLCALVAVLVAPLLLFGLFYIVLALAIALGRH